MKKELIATIEQLYLERLKEVQGTLEERLKTEHQENFPECPFNCDNCAHVKSWARLLALKVMEYNSKLN